MAKPLGQDVELGLLRTFLAVAHHGSVSRTAAASAMTQPAVSRQVSRLEKIVGQILFERSRDGVKLTHHGELLVSYANRAIDLSEETLVRLRADHPEGFLLGMSAEAALISPLAALKKIQKVYPNVQPKVIVTDPGRLDRMLHKGQLDLAIGEPALLGGTPIMQWNANLSWAASADFSIDRSQALPLVLFERPCVWRDELLDSLRRAGWEWRVVFESSSLDAILAAVESGIGMSALLLRSAGNSGIRPVEHSELPSPPAIQFGLFRGNAGPSRVQAAMEAALAMAFGIKSRDSQVVNAKLIFYEHSQNPEPNASCGRLRVD